MKQTLALVTGFLLMGGIGVAQAGDISQPLQLSALQLGGITAGTGSSNYLNWCFKNKKNPKDPGSHQAYADAYADAYGKDTITATWTYTETDKYGSHSGSSSTSISGVLAAP